MSRQPLLLLTLSISSTCRDVTKTKPPQPPKEDQRRERFSNAAVQHIHPMRPPNTSVQHTPPRDSKPKREAVQPESCDSLLRIEIIGGAEPYLYLFLSTHFSGTGKSRFRKKKYFSSWEDAYAYLLSELNISGNTQGLTLNTTEWLVNHDT